MYDGAVSILSIPMKWLISRRAWWDRASILQLVIRNIPHALSFFSKSGISSRVPAAKKSIRRWLGMSLRISFFGNNIKNFSAARDVEEVVRFCVERSAIIADFILWVGTRAYCVELQEVYWRKGNNSGTRRRIDGVVAGVVTFLW